MSWDCAPVSPGLAEHFGEQFPDGPECSECCCVWSSQLCRWCMERRTSTNHLCPMSTTGLHDFLGGAEDGSVACSKCGGWSFDVFAERKAK